MGFQVVQVPMSHLGWLVERTNVDVSLGFRAIAVVDNDDVGPCPWCSTPHARIKAMVGYSDWTPAGVAMHVALDLKAIKHSERRDAMRALRKAAFEYPFKENGRKFAIGLTRASYDKALRLARRLGFKEVYRIKDGWDVGEDLIMSRIEASDVE